MVERYFAYGSNLWIEQMVERTGPILEGEGRPCRAFLPNHRLIFNVPGEHLQVFANVVSPGSGVYGVVYCLSSDALMQLDKFENGYARRRMLIRRENGEQLEAFLYVADLPETLENGTPSAEYLRRIMTGARQHGLPDGYLREIGALASGMEDTFAMSQSQKKRVRR
jgi:gamma-glutamylcyclotransferase